MAKVLNQRIKNHWDNKLYSKAPGETVQLDRYKFWGKLVALFLGN